MARSTASAPRTGTALQAGQNMYTVISTVQAFSVNEARITLLMLEPDRLRTKVRLAHSFFSDTTATRRLSVWRLEGEAYPPSDVDTTIWSCSFLTKKQQSNP